MKRIFAVLLILVLVFGVMSTVWAEEATEEQGIAMDFILTGDDPEEEPVTGFVLENEIGDELEQQDEADDPYSGTSGDLTWVYNPGTATLTISGSGKMRDYAAAGMPWSAYADDIVSVVIKSGVTSIGASAFNDHDKLTSVSIASTVTSIGQSAFYSCDKLEKITLPASGTYYYKIRAYVCVGSTKLYGDYGTAVAIKKLAAPKLSPVTVEGNKATLSWTSVTGADGYTVYRKTAAGSTYTAVKSVVMNVTTCSSLKSATTYRFKVRPYVLVNGVKLYGPFSAEQSAVIK